MLSSIGSISQRSSTIDSSVSTPQTRIGSVLTERYKFVCSIVENRMKEIGIAVLNITKPEIELAHFTDNFTYINVITKLMIYYPQEILLPKTAVTSDLFKIISAKFSNCKVIPIARKYFDETKGAKYIQNLSIIGSTINAEVNEKYLCLAAIASLIKYTEFTQKLSIAANSLRISFVGKEGTIMIDSSTIENLEILCDSRCGNSKNSMYGILNHTQTVPGARLLRVNLCQPPCDENTINTRLDCVSEIARNENIFTSLKISLKEFPNIDRIISNLVMIESKKSIESWFQRNISAIINLKSLLEILPKMATVLENMNNGLLRAMNRNFSNPRIQIMLNNIHEIVNCEVIPKKQSLQMKIQQCLTIKNGVNGLLDVARKTYQETIEDINLLFEAYKEKYKDLSIQLQHSAKRGYYFRVPVANTQLPNIFIQRLKQKRYIVFSSEELISLNQRQKDSVSEILQISNRILEELFHKLRQNIACIYNISDTVSLLDMILSFVSFLSLNPNSVRPTFTKENKIIIKQGKHPIINMISENQFKGNDTIVSNNSNFQLISGANMSGKSTYIKQVALLTIMAHIGCFVTAEKFCVRLTDHIFSRIGTSDSIEDNASSFMLEMRDMAYILQNKTSNSIVIIDELGRGTSLSDACSLAWSCAEELIESKCITFFVTHYEQLNQLSKIYSNVALFHFNIQQQENYIIYNHKIAKGYCKTESYGINLAKLKAGFPSKVIDYSISIVEELETSNINNIPNANSSTDVEINNLILQAKNLQHSTLEREEILILFKDIQQRLKEIIKK